MSDSRVTRRRAFALHDELTATTWDEAMEDILKVHTDLLERTLDSFILLTIQIVDELHNLIVLLTLSRTSSFILLALLSELLILIERLLVHVTKL